MAIVDARVVIVWATIGGSAVNTLHARFDDAITSFQDCAEAFRDNLETHLLPVMADGVSLDEVQVGDDVGGGIAPGSASGGLAQAELPPGTSTLVIKQCSVGRNGRWFWPGITEAQVADNGSLVAGPRITLQAAFDAFLSAMEADAVDMRVEQKGGGFSQIDSFVVRPFVSFQQRRLRRARS